MKTFQPEIILAQMTTEEKISLVQGETFFGTRPIERLGIPRLQFLDGGTGINFEQLFGDIYSRPDMKAVAADVQDSSALAHVITYYYEPEKLAQEEKEIREHIRRRLLELTGETYSPACFPTGMLLGATFDPAICYETGEALGEEARLFDIDILLGTPNINIQRDPLNGRLFESFSEDPQVVRILAPELVKGVQSKGVLANVKHFAANNQETNRLGINEIISERALEEIYYPGFRACVEEGGVQTLMSAYNAINGIPCTESQHLLRTKLREEWGFEGCVISDWGAVCHPVAALLGGTDLAMPGPLEAHEIEKGIAEGTITEEELDRNVLAILRMAERALEGRRRKKESCAKIKKKTDRVAYRAALSGCVLLKNKDFPLQDRKDYGILLAGTGREKILACGSGSAGITTDRESYLHETLRGHLVNVSVEISEDTELKEHLAAISAGGRTPHVICVASLNGMEGNDRKDLLLQTYDRNLLHTVTEYKKQSECVLTLVLNVCGPVDLSEFEDAVDNLWLCFLPGMEGARALGDLMCGHANPSGKLPLTFPRKYEDTPTCLNFPGDGKEVYYGEGIYVGYRYYDKKQIMPAYPFGFGLSYTSFHVEILLPEHVKKAVPGEEGEGMLTFTPEREKELRLSVRIRNTGNRAGAEVVQLYISDPVSTLSKPLKELKKFRKIYLETGEEQEFAFVLTKEDFASYDPNLHAFTAEEGVYELLIATSSTDIRDVARIYLETDSPYSYGPDTSVKEFYENPELKELLLAFWAEQGWEMQILESNYQYTSQRTLHSVLPKGEEESEAVKRFYSVIDERIKKW